MHGAYCRFLNYNLMHESIKGMLNDWDRVKGVVRLKKSSPPQEMPEQRKISTTPKKKGRKVIDKVLETSDFICTCIHPLYLLYPTIRVHV